MHTQMTYKKDNQSLSGNYKKKYTYIFTLKAPFFLTLAAQALPRHQEQKKHCLIRHLTRRTHHPPTHAICPTPVGPQVFPSAAPPPLPRHGTKRIERRTSRFKTGKCVMQRGGFDAAQAMTCLSVWIRHRESWLHNWTVRGTTQGSRTHKSLHDTFRVGSRLSNHIAISLRPLDLQ